MIFGMNKLVTLVQLALSFKTCGSQNDVIDPLKCKGKTKLLKLLFFAHSIFSLQLPLISSTKATIQAQQQRSQGRTAKNCTQAGTMVHGSSIQSSDLCRVTGRDICILIPPSHSLQRGYFFVVTIICVNKGLVSACCSTDFCSTLHPYLTASILKNSKGEGMEWDRCQCRIPRSEVLPVGASALPLGSSNDGVGRQMQP